MSFQAFQGVQVLIDVVFLLEGVAVQRSQRNPPLLLTRLPPRGLDQVRVQQRLAVECQRVVIEVPDLPFELATLRLVVV